jgi:hypothetical protein
VWGGNYFGAVKKDVSLGIANEITVGGRRPTNLEIGMIETQDLTRQLAQCEEDQCERCLKLTDGIHTCTPTPLVRGLEHDVESLAVEIEMLRGENARLTAELDQIRDYHKRMPKREIMEQLASLTKERDMLVEALKIECRPPTWNEDGYCARESAIAKVGAGKTGEGS